MKAPLLPPSLWQKLLEFLVKGRHGRIELDVADGQIVNIRFLESCRVKDFI